MLLGLPNAQTASLQCFFCGTARRCRHGGVKWKNHQGNAKSNGPTPSGTELRFMQSVRVNKKCGWTGAPEGAALAAWRKMWSPRPRNSKLKPETSWTRPQPRGARSSKQSTRQSYPVAVAVLGSEVAAVVKVGAHCSHQPPDNGDVGCGDLNLGVGPTPSLSIWNHCLVFPARPMPSDFAQWRAITGSEATC